jgi:hypothetical protein
MATKLAVPELNVNSGKIADLSVLLQTVSKQIADLQTQEKNIKEEMRTTAEGIRMIEANKDNFIGILRVTGEEAPMRAEFRIMGLALPVDEDFSAFDGAQNQLFEKKRTLFKKKKGEVFVSDVALLIEDIKKANLSINDILSINIENEDALLGLNSEAIQKVEAYVPVEGFLNKINEIVTKLSKGAKDFLRERLKDTMSTAICPGAKGKGK